MLVYSRGPPESPRGFPHLGSEAGREEARIRHEVSEALLSQPAGADVERVRYGHLVMVKRGLSFGGSGLEWVAPPLLTEGNGHGPGVSYGGVLR